MSESSHGPAIGDIGTQQENRTQGIGGDGPLVYDGSVEIIGIAGLLVVPGCEIERPVHEILIVDIERRRYQGMDIHLRSALEQDTVLVDQIYLAVGDELSEYLGRAQVKMRFKATELELGCTNWTVPLALISKEAQS